MHEDKKSGSSSFFGFFGGGQKNKPSAAAAEVPDEFEGFSYKDTKSVLDEK